MKTPSNDEITKLAYLLWEQDGRQHGRDMEYWLLAEAKLKEARSASAKKPARKSIPTRKAAAKKSPKAAIASPPPPKPKPAAKKPSKKKAPAKKAAPLSKARSPKKISKRAA